ncbi:MAG: TlyA family RNA methyltransferase [Cyanobacteria bacterium]|nr:TlyA family RNA methyltransferase [Cyanobacteriota bacterium]
MAKQRLDELLFDRGLCDSLQQAQRLIQAGEVRVNHTLVDKVGTAVDVGAIVEMKARSRFVSRGGEKLIKALETFGIDVTDRVCLDGGISTGGFTDCLLQCGASRIYGVDVGYGQVAWKLQSDDRVVIRERTNIRTLQPEDLYSESDLRPDLGVVDVSFISLVKVMPAIHRLLVNSREVLLLVKPQFEVGRDRIGAKGVVRNPADQAWAIDRVLTAGLELGWNYQGLTWSPITGPAGNIEYLLWLRQSEGIVVPGLDELVKIAETARSAIVTQSQPTDTSFTASP